jgi:crotonobetaine/carnitine-CoA ligase
MSASMNDRTLLGSLKKAVELLGNRPMVRFTDGETHSATAVENRAAAFGAVLLRQGVNAGDRVAILCTNRVEFIWTFFGACWIGAVPAPLNTSLHGQILRNMIEDLDPTIVVCERETETAVRKATIDLPKKPIILDIDASPEIERLRDGQSFEPPQQHESASSDLAMILYTSGTTGRSKGIMYSHEMAMTFSEASHWMLGYAAQDVAFNCLPLFHGNSLLCTLVPAMRAGAFSVFAPRFSANTFWATVRAEGATVLSLLGSMVPILMNQAPSPNDNASRARIALAVPAPGKSFFQFQERFNLKLSSLYGMTDIGLPIGVPADTPGRPGMCGILHENWECIVADDHDRPLPDGEIGEALIRPRRPYIMQLGYWRNPAATVDTWRNLWFHTGDYLRRDGAGWFEFIDRKKDAIRRFGENISSFEVETVLLGHAAIAEAAVYAVPADLEEDEVMASVVIEPGMHVTAPELLEYCTENLPYFAVPRYIRITPSLPKTQTAKVQKQELRRIAIDELSWDAGPRGRTKRS